MSATDELLGHAAGASDEVAAPGVPAAPARRVAIVTCMDARIDPAKLFGLNAGDAHVIRNAGGVVTDDALRSLVISQRKLGTTEVIVMAHTTCGMLTFTEDELRAELREDTGQTPTWPAEVLTDLDAGVRDSVARVKGSPFLPHRDQVRGFVLDVEAGTVREIA